MSATATILLFLHILSAIIAVGTNISYLIWLRRAVLVPESREFTLTTVRILELRLAIPAYVTALATGVGLVLATPYEFNTPWIELSILLWVAIMALGGFHARVIKRQIAIAGSADSDAYEAGHARSRVLMLLMALCALATLYLMVAKPPLWSG